jgi:hypothetical protein
MPRKPEWTLIAAALAAVLDWVVGFKLEALSAEQAAAVMVAINAVVAVVVAYKTRPIPPQVYTYLIASLAALGGAYGLNFNAEHTATFTAAAIAVLGLITRHQVSPVESVDTRVLGQPATAGATTPAPL